MESTTLELLNKILIYDKETYYHSIRVGCLTKNFSSFMNYKGYNIDLHIIETAGYLHDVGKLTIDKDILNKLDKLTENEYSIMKTHSDNGINYLKSQNCTLCKTIDLCIKYHHLGFSKEGYPKQTEKITKANRLYIDIITICDVFDALTSKRIYKEQISIDKTLEIMDSMRGITLNPKLYKNFKDFLNN